MMEHATIDTLHFTKHLEGKGFDRMQAEGIVEAMKDMEESLITGLRTEMRNKDDSYATKADIRMLQVDINRLEQATNTDIRMLQVDINRLEQLMSDSEKKMILEIKMSTKDTIIWIGGVILAVGGGFIACLFKYLPVLAKMVEIAGDK